MIGDAPYQCCKLVIVCKESSSVAVASQVLGGEEGGAAYSTHCTCFLHRAVAEAILSSRSLSDILDYIEPVAVCQINYRFHVSTLAEEMYRHNCFCAWRNGFLDCLNTDIESTRIRFNKYQTKTKELNDLNCGNEGEVGGDDLIPRPETESHHGYLQCIGAIGAGDNITYSHVTLELLLKKTYIRSLDECRGVDDTGNSTVQVCLKPLILLPQVNHLNLFHHNQI